MSSGLRKVSKLLYLLGFDTYSNVLLGKYLSSTIGGSRPSCPPVTSESVRAFLQFLWSGDRLVDFRRLSLLDGDEAAIPFFCVFPKSKTRPPSSASFISNLSLIEPTSSKRAFPGLSSNSFSRLMIRCLKTRFSESSRDVSASRLRIRRDCVEFAL